MQNCVKKPGAGLSNVANHKLWHGELFEDAACLGLAQQEALDAPSDRLFTYMYVLLDGKEVLGGNYANFQHYCSGGHRRNISVAFNNFFADSQ